MDDGVEPRARTDAEAEPSSLSDPAARAALFERLGLAARACEVVESMLDQCSTA